MGKKKEKSLQRNSYKESLKNVKHGHGGRAVKKKQEFALGR